MGKRKHPSRPLQVKTRIGFEITISNSTNKQTLHIANTFKHRTTEHKRLAELGNNCGLMLFSWHGKTSQQCVRNKLTRYQVVWRHELCVYQSFISLPDCCGVLGINLRAGRVRAELGGHYSKLSDLHLIRGEHVIHHQSHERATSFRQHHRNASEPGRERSEPNISLAATESVSGPAL